MNRLEILFELAKGFYDNGDPGHDLNHIRRVMATCYRIGELERANLDVLLAAALLHDVVNVPKDHPQRFLASEKAADCAANLLHEANFDKGEIDKIMVVIKEHSYSRGLHPSSIESAILQDADKLDATGAIGIMRTVTCGARMGAAYYDMNEPFAQTRDLNDRAFTIDHFYTKLLKLPDLMNTKAGADEAQRRVVFMKSFLDQLRSELDGTLFCGHL